MSKSIREMTCWVVTEGMIGTQNQCVGLAERLGLTPVIKKMALKSPWKQLCPWLPWGYQHALTADSDQLDPPYPDIIISSGRKSIGPVLDIKRRSTGKTYVIQIQDPKYPPEHFDLVIAPHHDAVMGKNVIKMAGTLHRITAEKLNTAAIEWQDHLQNIPHPRVAVLIGGASKSYQINEAKFNHVVDQLAGLQNCGLMVTASRRTGGDRIERLRSRLDRPDTFFYDGTNGENPYFGLLGLADYIIVSEDSVSMVSEAVATGRPVYTVSLGRGRPRLEKCQAIFREKGYTRPFDGGLNTEKQISATADLDRVVDLVKDKIALHFKGKQEHD